MEGSHLGAHRHPGGGGAEVVERRAPLADRHDLVQRGLHPLTFLGGQALHRLGHSGEPAHVELLHAVGEAGVDDLHLGPEQVTEHRSGGFHRVGHVRVDVDVAQGRAQRDP